MSKKERNERLKKDAFISKDSYEARSKALSRKIEADNERAKLRIQEKEYKLILLENGLFGPDV